VAFGLGDSIEDLLRVVRRVRPDIVFNQCEAFAGDRSLEPQVAGLFDLLGLPYTGASPRCLELCADKGLTKKILSYHRVRVPAFAVSTARRPMRRSGGLRFPVIVKPLEFEASEGIAQSSFASNWEEARARVEYLHGKFGCDVILEEYVEGRELYVSLLAEARPQVFALRELVFGAWPEGKPRIATYQAKWNDDYRKKWGIRSDYARSLDPKVEQRILQVGKKIASLFELRGPARVDLRLTEEGEIVFLEANPNPCLYRGEDFASAAERSGLDYPALLDRILQQAWRRRRPLPAILRVA